METDSTDRFVPKDLPVYSWHNKQEGKDQYARFVKEFISSIKHLRYLLEPGAVQRRLGEHPGAQPLNANLRKEWREDMRAYQTRLQKIDEHFATALGALESSFVFASSPRHIIDKAIENVPPVYLLKNGPIRGSSRHPGRHCEPNTSLRLLSTSANFGIRF